MPKAESLRSLDFHISQVPNYGNTHNLFYEAPENHEMDPSRFLFEVSQQEAEGEDRRTQKKILEDSECLKFVVDSIINVDDHDKLTPPEKKEQ
ncbi:hypothetical protein HAX54_021376, partial [Datura stramonium]|nr:hypothetical protein [Datura stramonium]